MDVVLIIAIVLVLVFIGALIYVKRRPAGSENEFFFFRINKYISLDW